MRCMITANRRARATIAFLIPRCLAIFMAHALSHDHFAQTQQHGAGHFVEHHPHHLVPRTSISRQFG